MTCRLCKALEDIHRSSAMQDARKRRSQLAQDCVRLGKIVSMRMVRSRIFFLIRFYLLVYSSLLSLLFFLFPSLTSILHPSSVVTHITLTYMLLQCMRSLSFTLFSLFTTFLHSLFLRTLLQRIHIRHFSLQFFYLFLFLFSSQLLFCVTLVRHLFYQFLF